MHGLHGPVPCGELLPTARAQQTCALLQQDGAPLLVVDPRGPSPYGNAPTPRAIDRARGRAWPSISSSRVRAVSSSGTRRPVATRMTRSPVAASGASPGLATTLNGRRRRSTAAFMRDRSDAGSASSLSDRGRYRRGRGLGEPGGARAAAAPGDCRFTRLEPSAGEVGQLAASRRRAHRRFQRELASAVEIERLEREARSARALPRPVEGAAELVVRPGRVRPARRRPPARAKLADEPDALAAHLAGRERREDPHLAGRPPEDKLDLTEPRRRLRQSLCR